jgi:hypothetical protein
MKRPPLDEVIAILNSLSSFIGDTTADGGIAGDTVICSQLIGSNDFITNHTILIESGLQSYESQTASIFDNATGKITLASNFGGQILKGTKIYILVAGVPVNVDLLLNSLVIGAGVTIGTSVVIGADLSIGGNESISANQQIGGNQLIGGNQQIGGSILVGGSETIAGDFIANGVSIPAALQVPVANSPNNVLAKDVLGNKSDTAVTMVGVVASIIAYIKGILLHLVGVISTAGSPYSLPNDVNEHTVISLAAAQQLAAVEIDLTNLTQNNTIREYSNGQQISAKLWPTSFDAGTKRYVSSMIQQNAIYAITMQASVLEGAPRNIPFTAYTKAI